MGSPKVKVVAVSNVYSRLMYFVNKGDVEVGHSHTYDHATLLSNGSVLYEVLDGPDGNTVASKEFYAPGYIFVEKNKFHRITALEDKTVCACIHAMRTIDEDIVPPDIIIEPIHTTGNGEIINTVENGTGKQVKSIINTREMLEAHHG